MPDASTAFARISPMINTKDPDTTKCWASPCWFVRLLEASAKEAATMHIQSVEVYVHSVKLTFLVLVNTLKIDESVDLTVKPWH